MKKKEHLVNIEVESNIAHVLPPAVPQHENEVAIIRVSGGIK